MLPQHVVESSDLRGEVGRSESEQEDSCVRVSQTNDEITEVEITGDQYPLLFVGNGEDILVRQAVRILSTDSGCIIAERQEMRDQAGISALVEQKPHAETRVALPAMLASVRSRSSARWA